MGHHFVLLVTESSHAAGIESKSISNLANEELATDVCIHRMDHGFESLKKFVECRICHDEDEDSNMETPCACCGSLKYAHRKCVQRWCNEKGNTICEICLQPFKPGYSSPPPLFHCDGIPMNFRRDLYSLRFSAMDSVGHVEPEFDEYITLSTKSLICCRVIAIIFMALLVLRHTLPIIMNGTQRYTVTMFTFVMLRSLGVLLSIYIMVRVFASVQRRQQVQDHDPSDEESNLAEETRLHIVHVH
ncbi:uncharacterized protein LOC143581420 isoform X2 [Bidens hawaiensis]|uniref:uncharacterized protein LOC143581420 isoform X2 n=1 Tax=Bidens hawaiensis TaxID=980011 RepID=UPI00404A31CB